LDSGDTGDSSLSGTSAWLAEQWFAVLGVRPGDEDADFFQLGGGSLAAAQLVSRLRTRAPEFTMTDVYDLPRLRQMADAVDDDAEGDDAEERVFSQPVPTPRRMQWVQTIAGLPLFVFSGIRWLLFLLTASWLLRLSPGFEFLPDVPAWALIVGLLIFVTPVGKMTI
ncbi:amino acid adenylation protein, partial [Pseudomonas sp. BGM005]|nr:amino acid adenylation protein [Pseudomonas sp. BG5]